MSRSFRSLARISSLSLVLALTVMALPQAQNVHAYVQNITYTGPSISSGVSVTEGNTWTGQLGTFNDDCLDVKNFTAPVDWGDGHTDTAQVVAQGTAPSGGLCQYGIVDSHVYGEEGQDTLVVSVKNLNDGSVGHVTATVGVADAPLTPSNAQTLTPTEGQQFVGAFLGDFTDGNQPTNPDPNAGNTVCGSTSKDFTVSIDWGDNTPESGGIIAPDYTGTCLYGVTGTHLYKDEGSYPVTVTVTDHDSVAIINAIANVADASLAMVTPAGFETFEGQGVTNQYLGTFHDLSPNCDVNDYSVSINWADDPAAGPDISTGSLVPNTAAGQCRFDVFGSHVSKDEGTFNPVVTITDHSASVQLTDTANIADQVIQAVAHGDFKAIEGQPVGYPNAAGQLLGTLHDLNPFCTAGDYAVSVNWGDGTGLDTNPADFSVVADAAHPGNCNFLIYGQHTYAEQNPSAYPVSVTVQDVGGKKVVLSEHAAVADAALTTVTGTTFTVTEGQQFTNSVGTFHDPAGDYTLPTACDIGDYTAVIDWGDGTTSTVTSATDAATVGNIVPSTAGGTCNFDVIGVHTYAEENPNPSTASNPSGYPISVTVTDTAFDRTIIPSTANINVVDAPLTNATPGGSLSNLQQTEGKPFANYYLGTFNDAAFTDAGHTYCDPADYSVQVDWGDGGVNPHGAVTTAITSAQSAAGIAQTASAANGAAGTCNFDVLGSYDYLEESVPGTFTVNITVTDNGKPDGSGSHPTVSWSDTMNVLDAPLSNPTGTGFNNLTFHPVEGKPVTNQYLGTILDADPGCDVADFNASPGSIAIDWGDGTAVDNNNAGGTGHAVLRSLHNVTTCAVDIYGSHNYAEDSSSADSGPYKVHVVISDNGASATLDDTASVVDAPLTTLAQVQPSFTEGVLDGPNGALKAKGRFSPSPNLHYLGTIHDAAGDTLGNGNCDLGGGDYSAIVQWGDGSQDTLTQKLLITPTSKGVIQPAAGANGHAGACNFDIMGSHLYKEETEPHVVNTIKITFVDEGGSTTSLLDPATVVDAPLTDMPNTVKPAGCTLLTACTVQVATFLDNATSCAAENENLGSEPLHYMASINWGDGSPRDAKVTITKDPSAACTFDVTGTHIFASPGRGATITNSHGLPFDVTATIVDEGGSVVTTSDAGHSSTMVPVTIPAGTLPTPKSKANPFAFNTITYAFQLGTGAAYRLDMSIQAYAAKPANTTVSYTGYIGFTDDQFKNQTPGDHGIAIGAQPKGSCQTPVTTTFQCEMNVLSMVYDNTKCTASAQNPAAPPEATVWAAFKFYSDGTDGLPKGTLQTRWVKIHSMQGPPNSAYEFDVTTSPASPNPNAAYVLHEPSIPINAVKIGCS